MKHLTFRRLLPLAAAFLLTALLATPVQAEVPALVPTQGILYDSAGVPLSGSYEVSFSLYNGLVSEEPLWSERQTLEFSGGLFSAYLGAASPLPLTLIRDTSALTLGLAIGEDPESTRIPFGAVPYAAYSQYCADATTLDGLSADDLLDLVELGAYSDADAIAATSGLYAPFDHTHSWADITTGIPAGFADGIDNDSGGDITSVGASTGLTGGGDIGAVTLAIDPNFVQRRVVGDCPANQAIRQVNIDGSVVCAASGDITGVLTGPGLTGGSDSGTVTIQADTSYLQRRVAVCAAGSAIRAIGEDGSVTCEVDDVNPGDITSVGAGSGLTGGGAAGDVSLAADFGLLDGRYVNADSDSMSGNLNVGGTLSAGNLNITNCRLCLYYADNNGGSGRRFACVQLANGANSGNMNFAGDVDSNDIVRMQVQCDGGASTVGVW